MTNITIAIVMFVIASVLALKVVGWIFKLLAIPLLGAAIYILVS